MAGKVKEVKPRNVKFCPNCKSLNISADMMSGWFFGFPASYNCNECGRKSKFFPEVDINKINGDKK